MIDIQTNNKGKKVKGKLYFVIETKGSTEQSLRRVTENMKIECAKKHFETIDVNYKDVSDYHQFETIMTS